MIILKDFITEEVNTNIRDIILVSVKQGKDQNKYKDELVFNRYSLEFLFHENTVVIYDDIFIEDEPLKLSLDEFLLTISNYS